MTEAGIAGLAGVVTFQLCGQTFGLAVGDVREVVPVAWLDRPPQMPGVVQGILNLGGKAVPVLRLDRLLGLEDGHYGLDASILVMREAAGDGRVFGLLVEHVDKVRDIDAFTALGISGDQSFNACLADQLTLGEAVVQLLAWRNILLVEERERLADFAARAEERLAAFEAGPP